TPALHIRSLDAALPISAACSVPVFSTAAGWPGSRVTTSPTWMVAAAPGLPSIPSVPFLPGAASCKNGTDGIDGIPGAAATIQVRSEKHTTELQSRFDLV